MKIYHTVIAIKFQGQFISLLAQINKTQHRGTQIVAEVTK